MIGKWLGAVVVGFSATLACVAATAGPDEAKSPDVQPLTTSGAPGSPGAAMGADALNAAADAGNGGDGGCPHGALEDSHRGFVRCLGPGEKSPFAPNEPDAGAGDAGDGGTSDGGAGDGGVGDAGVPSAPSTPGAAPTSAPSAAPTSPPPVVSGPPPAIEMKTPKFENGEVPKVEKVLSGTKLLDAIARCVGDAGGLSGKTGSLKVELLVRLRGKAEGVEVTPTGVSQEAAKCVRVLFKNRAMGTPTADPVGVTVIYGLKAPGK